MAQRSICRLVSAGRTAWCALSRQVTSTHTQCTTSLHSSAIRCNEHIINIQDEADFKTRVLQNDAPVVVDFHAEWCGPCKILGPRLEELVGKRTGKVILAKVDIDSNTELAVEHGVQAVPTVLAMKAGKVMDRFVGVQDDAHLKSFIDSLTGE